MATGRHTGAILSLLYRDGRTGKWKMQAVGDFVTGSMLQTISQTLGDGGGGGSGASGSALHFDTLSLRKGDVLAYEGPQRILVGLGWDCARGREADLDAVCLLVNGDSEVIETIDGANLQVRSMRGLERDGCGSKRVLWSVL